MTKAELFKEFMFTKENMEEYLHAEDMRNSRNVICVLNDSLHTFLSDDMTKDEGFLVMLAIRWAYYENYYMPSCDNSHWEYTFLCVEEGVEVTYYDLNPAGIQRWVNDNDGYVLTQVVRY